MYVDINGSEAGQPRKLEHKTPYPNNKDGKSAKANKVVKKKPLAH